MYDRINVKQFREKPDNSIIGRGLDAEIHYIDSFSIKFMNRNQYSIDYLTALLFSSIPAWVRILLNLRSILVKPFGLDTGTLPAQHSFDVSLRYHIGDTAVFFPVVDRSESEIVMAKNDKHLYFRTSLYVEKTSDQHLLDAYLTTLVKFHNIGGRLYFAPVKPFHKLIMRTLLKNFSNASQ